MSHSYWTDGTARKIMFSTPNYESNITGKLKEKKWILNI